MPANARSAETGIHRRPGPCAHPETWGLVWACAGNHAASVLTGSSGEGEPGWKRFAKGGKGAAAAKAYNESRSQENKGAEADFDKIREMPARVIAASVI